MRVLFLDNLVDALDGLELESELSETDSDMYATSDEEEDGGDVTEFVHEGETYYRDDDGLVYDKLEDAEVIGTWNPVSQTIDPVAEEDEDEESVRTHGSNSKRTVKRKMRKMCTAMMTLNSSNRMRQCPNDAPFLLRALLSALGRGE